MSPLLKKITIGEMCIGSDSTVISTILGPCVSVCLYSKKAMVGGMIHFGLPDRSYAQNSSRGNLHFGNLAIQILLEKILAIPDVKLSELKAKIIGGANICTEVTHSRELGSSNIEIARRTLKSLGIDVESEDVGGEAGREMFFYTSTGRVRVTKLPPSIAKPTDTKNKKKIKVLVVDDSKTIQQLLIKVLTSDSIEVVGTAFSADEALPLLGRLRPDVITLDIHMPGIDGVSFLKRFLPRYPIPTIMISSIGINEGDYVMEALELGAVDYIQKPTIAEISNQTELIREKIKIAAGIKVQTRSNLIVSGRVNINYKDINAKQKLIAVGSSTGGTEAVKTMLMSLPANIPPILIVQHIPPVFSSAFAKRLNELCPFEIKEAADGDGVIPGRVLIAPGGLQMELLQKAGVRTVRIFEGEKVNRHRPSVDVLFDSVAKLAGKDAIGIILTGMGDDGAKGLLKMKTAGAFTIAQDEASCVVYGMPKAAVLLNAVTKVLPLGEIGRTLIQMLEKAKVA